MLQYSTVLQKFIYVVVGWSETASYTRCAKSAVIRNKPHEIST